MKNGLDMASSYSPTFDPSFPVNFVCPASLVWPELQEPTSLPLGEEVLSRRSGGLMNNWVLRPYHGLRALGCSVELSEEVKELHINIVSANQFGRRNRVNRAFVVCARGDAHRPMLANFVINQNFLRSPTSASGNVYHFPQPGIKKRDATRGTTISVIAFKGHEQSLSLPFRSPGFMSRLSERGIEFEQDFRDRLTGEHRWDDYSAVDLVLAVRNLTFSDARHKPASKLVNAWIAGVPAILGPEPAFEELRRTPEDFLVVRTVDEALSAIDRLRANPTLYRAMVENGLQRAVSFQEDAILGQWIDLLNGPISKAALDWYSRRPPLQWMSVAYGLMSEPLSKKTHRYLSKSGKRLLG